MRNRSKAALLVGFVTAMTLVTPSVASATSCAQQFGTINGRIVKVDGKSVTYRVETFQPGRYYWKPRPPAPIPGHLVVVHYGRYDHEFLHVGRRYSASVGWITDPPFPDVDGFFSILDSDICGFRTVNADGTAIDTALIRQPHVRRWFFELVGASVVVALLTSAWAIRKRRRQRKNVEALVNAAS